MTFLNSPLNRALLIVALFLIIGLFSYFTLIQPELTQFNASQQRLAGDIQTYNDLKRVADQKPEYIALTKQIQTRLAHVELTADPRVYVPSYLKQIESLAKQDGLEVTAVTPQAAPAPSPGASAAPAPIATVNPKVSAFGPINSAHAAVGADNTQTQTTANAAGATPVPGAPAGAAPAGSANGRPGAPATATSSARANAIAYLSQSFTQVPINMELAGTYSQLERFLRDLNKFPKLIGVGNVTLTPGANAGVGETPTLTIVLPIIAYRLSPSEQTQPVPGATPVPGPTRNGG